jgi:hypothetical protein
LGFFEKRRRVHATGVRFVSAKCEPAKSRLALADKIPKNHRKLPFSRPLLWAPTDTATPPPTITTPRASAEERSKNHRCTKYAGMRQNTATHSLIVHTVQFDSAV